MAIVQYARKNEVVYVGNSLKPDANVVVFIGDNNVTDYCQPGNRINVTSYAAASNLRSGIGIISSATNAFARVLGTSNTFVYLDQNYLNINIGQYGTSILQPTQYKPNDLICQSRVQKIIVQEPVGLSAGRWYRSRRRGYGSGLLAQYGVDTWDGNKYWLRRYRILFPKTGWYQFHYQTDEYFSLTVDGVNKVAETYTGRRQGEEKVKYLWMTAGGHDIEFYLVNRGRMPQSLALIIRGPGTAAIETATPSDYNNPPFLHTNFSLGYFNVTDWTSPIGDQYDKVYYPNGILIFNTRNPPKAVEEFKVVTTFIGRVQYYDKANNVMTIRPEAGTFSDATDDESSTLRLIGENNAIKSSPLANVKSVNYGNLFPPNAKIFEVADARTGTFSLTANSAQLISDTNDNLRYNHVSGVIAGFNPVLRNPNDLNQIIQANVMIQANVSSADYIGRKFNYSDADGNWRTSIISAVNNNNEIEVQDGFTGAEFASNTHYGIGNIIVDRFGVCIGQLNIPEGPNNRLAAGEYKVRLADSASLASQTMEASAIYRSGTFSESSTTVIADRVTSVKTTDNSAEYQTIKSNWARRGFDPMAQVFYVPGTNVNMSGETIAPYGMWLTSVDLWFSDRGVYAASSPVLVRIVRVVNNLPSDIIMGEASVSWSNIKVAPITAATTAGGTPTSPLYTDAATLTVNENYTTKFVFPDPIFLEPDTKYAIAVLSDSPDYKVYIAQSATKNIGSGATISGEPNVEQFYKSQNASVWTPIIGTDLMFRINKAKFIANTNGYARFKVGKVANNPASNVNIDFMVMSGTQILQPKSSTRFNLKANNSLGQETDYQSVDLDQLTYFSADLTSSNKTSSRRRTFTPGDLNSLIVDVGMTSSSSDTTCIVNKERLAIRTFENIINNAGINRKDVIVTNPGKHANVSNISVTFSSPISNTGTGAVGIAQLSSTISNNDVFMSNAGSYTNRALVSITISAPDIPAANGGVRANAYIIASGSGGISASDIVFDIPGSGYVNAAPTITFSSGTTTATANIRTNVAAIITTYEGSGYLTSPTITISEANTSGLGAYTNATAVVYGEDQMTGGNCLTRYISKRIDLMLDAGDLRVYLDCIRPAGTDIAVYYKVKSPYDGDSIDVKKWQYMEKVVDNYSADEGTMIELEYRPILDSDLAISYKETGLDGVERTYPLGGVFRQFMIKIVLTAENPTVAPTVTNFSAIATPSG